MTDTEPRCPECGYTRDDANTHLDHYLCKGKIPEQPHDTEPFAAPLYERSEPPADDLLAKARAVATCLRDGGQPAFADVVNRLVERLADIRAAANRCWGLLERAGGEVDELIAALDFPIPPPADTREGDEQR